FLLTLFDYHTTRRLVPLFHIAFAMVPMGFAALALRLPDDVELLDRHPWIIRALDATGLALGLAMVGSHLAGGTTAALRSVCTALFGASFLFFAVTFLVRFARAEGDRHALWGSRALLSRVLVRGVIVAATCSAAVALGASISVVFGAPLQGALIAS